MTSEFVQEIELDYSPIPDGCLRRLVEATYKKDGQIWRIHKNDVDPFPSSPHAHNVESGLVLDLSSGKLYFGRRDTGKSVSRKDLLELRAMITDVALPLLTNLIQLPRAARLKRCEWHYTMSNVDTHRHTFFFGGNMNAFNNGDKARIVNMPAEGRHLVGEIVTIRPTGGFNSEQDDVMVTTETGMMLFLKEQQLTKLDR